MSVMRATLLASWLLIPPPALAAAGSASAAPKHAPCPATTEIWVERGWSAYRADSMRGAASAFARARRLCPDHMDALVGLGFASLRLGRVAAADSLFARACELDPRSTDAWEGSTLAKSRLGRPSEALAAARRLHALAPGHATARAVLDAEHPGWDLPPRPARVRPATLQMPARVRGERFEVRSGGEWRPFHIQGVNLGAALPGRFPSEFPADSALYAEWLRLISGMNANTIRLYTVLPPVFYRALRDWNEEHAEAPLWLVHGVWTELPPEDDFDDAGWKAGFEAEMGRVVGLIHGACDIAPRPGHASGRYDADVSPWTLAYIIGREWEPHAIRGFDELARHRTRHAGRFLEVANGTPSEVWMTEMCDRMLAMEWDAHHALRPIAYTNWPTLDPLHHPTESSAAEERALRVRVGRPFLVTKLEYDNDAVQLDANVTRPTPANPAGWFASYHAYPYYPDFMNQDPGYAKARSSDGPSRYFGYLQELIRHHAGLPTVISEYGVPSSRGTAHLHPDGWHHGGHDEHEMAAIDARMTREIRESGAAGAILFAWIDEWFKKNWAVIDLQIPLESTRQWLNPMDAEQNYGVIAMLPGDSASRPCLGGDPRPWQALSVIAQGASPEPWSPTRVRMGSDEAWVYAAVEFANAPAGSVPWDSVGFTLAIDSFRPEAGQTRLPGLVERSEVGFEFLAEFDGPERAALRATPDYNPYASLPDPLHHDDRGVFYHRPAAPQPRSDGRFDSLLMTVNRARFARDGRFTGARVTNRGRLRYGTTHESSLSDWYYDERTRSLQVRLPWGLLHVTDPSTRQVLFDPSGEGDFGTATSDGFRIGVISRRGASVPRILGALPPLAADGVWPRAGFATWSWEPWTTPRFHTAIKPVYEAMRRVWSPSVTAPPGDVHASGREEGR